MSLSRKINEFFLGPKTKLALPQHVKDAIKQQQITSEKLISWMQLFVIIIFGILYYISPKAFPATVKFTPVPWALAGYLAFSLIRLILAYRNYLPVWFLMLSAIVDILLLMTLIWSFHLQYLQPASFYLKVPTLIYIFIFISLRALRFEAKYVITAGIAAAIGWFSLLIYAIKTTPSGTITRNYIMYMTSNHILIGAEFDKIITILMVTTILALAVARGRRLLIRSISETIATEELSKFFVPELAANIIQVGQEIKPGYGEQRDVAILHCDIRGFTEIAKHTSPTSLMQLLTEYQSRVVKKIRECNGSIDKFLGDGILASFNAIKSDVNYVADALRAAHETVKDNLAWNIERKAAGLNPIRIGVTVSIGQAILGIVGDKSRFEYTVIGNPVNEAAKLDKHCKIENCQALTTEEAFKKALEQGYQPSSHVEKLPKRHIEGMRDLIDLVVLER